MRRLLIALSLLPALLLGGMAPAAFAAANSAQIQTIRHLQHLETLSYKAATAFYLYNGMNRDPQLYKKMQKQLEEGDGLTQQLANGTVTSQWKNLKTALTTASFTEEGVADTESINAIDGTLSTLNKTLRSLAADSRSAGGIVVDKNADLLYEEYVLMQVMTAAYLRKSADLFGGAIVMSQGPQVEIDKLANQFSSQLKQLNQHYEKNPKISPLLREVTTKWTFVRDSFLNSNQNNVPYIIGRYNEQITDRLLSAYEQLLQ